jgi:hypothetical protein
LDVIVVVLVVVVLLAVVVLIVEPVVVLVTVVSPSPDSSDTVCEDSLAESPRRRPPTPMPIAPVREGPRIVCVYLSLVAPGKPEMLRGRVPDAEPSDSSGESGGLGGVVSSGHLVASASEAAVM